MKLLILVALNAAAAWLTVWLVPGLEYSGEWWRWLLFGAVIGLINAVIKPLAKLLTIPIRILTLGLFTLVINVGLMTLAIWIANDANLGLTSDSMWAVLLGGFVLTVVGSILNLLNQD
ncbi:MAG: phage holin family protein [Actinomycetota bacterium]|nr:phage holin family protein [Actinomycetota bacterium]